MKRSDADGVGVEGTKKNEDENAMDVEQTSVQPPVEETATNKHAREHPTNQLTSTDRKDTEDDFHVH